MNDELTMAQKLELVRNAMPKGFSLGYESAGERQSPLANPPSFPEFRATTTETEPFNLDNIQTTPDEQLAGPTNNSQCNSFKIYTETVGATPTLKVGAGQVGDIYVEETTLGAMSAAAGKDVFIELELDGDDGTLAATVKVGTPDPVSETLKFIYLGRVTSEGVIEQTACGPFGVTICRNWFAIASPYFGMTILNSV